MQAPRGRHTRWRVPSTREGLTPLREAWNAHPPTPNHSHLHSPTPTRTQPHPLTPTHTYPHPHTNVVFPPLPSLPFPPPPSTLRPFIPPPAPPHSAPPRLAVPLPVSSRSLSTHTRHFASLLSLFASLPAPPLPSHVEKVYGTKCTLMVF